MKITPAEMARDAWVMTRKKFAGLSVKRQHELLAALAIDTFLAEGNAFPRFQSRYRELLSFAALDHYEPPFWLLEKEALLEYAAFHNQFTPSPLSLPRGGNEEDLPTPLSWAFRYDVTIVLDQVTRPYNVGSILRIIDNFGFKRLIHGTKTLRVTHPQLRKSARGCEKWIPFLYEENLPSCLTSLDMPVFGVETDPDALPIASFNPTLPCAIVVGNETLGISDAVKRCCDALIQIPMHGFKKSMNVTHALSIVSYQIAIANT